MRLNLKDSDAHDFGIRYQIIHRRAPAGSKMLLFFNFRTIAGTLRSRTIRRYVVTMKGVRCPRVLSESVIEFHPHRLQTRQGLRYCFVMIAILKITRTCLLQYSKVSTLFLQTSRGDSHCIMTIMRKTITINIINAQSRTTMYLLL